MCCRWRIFFLRLKTTSRATSITATTATTPALRERGVQKKTADAPIAMPAIAPFDSRALEQSDLSAEKRTPSRVLSMEPTRPRT